MNITFELSAKSSRECWDKPLQLLTYLLFNGKKTISSVVGPTGFPQGSCHLVGQAYYVLLAAHRHSCMLGCACSVVSNALTPWTVACRVPLSMEFYRREYWNGLPFPSPRDLPKPRNQTHFSRVFCIGRQILYLCTWEAHWQPTACVNCTAVPMKG